MRLSKLTFNIRLPTQSVTYKKYMATYVAVEKNKHSKIHELPYVIRTVASNTIIIIIILFRQRDIT